MSDEADDETKQDAPTAQSEGVDLRFSFIKDAYLNASKLKEDKWNKSFSVPENIDVLVAFYEKENPGILVVYQNAKDDIEPSLGTFPKSFKKKTLYFCRRNPGTPLSKDKVTSPEVVKNEVCFGEFGPNPLEHLVTLIDSVFLPLVTNEKNHTGWPIVVVNDVLRHFFKIKTVVQVISGKVKGKTILPLPPGSGSPTDGEKQILHQLESAVIDWTHQIKGVIKSNSAQPLLEGLEPGPLVECDFWAAKCANLTCIYEQLKDKKIRKIAAILSRTKSSYFPAFKRIFQEVVASLNEARDINMYLQAFKPFAEQLLESTEFAEAEQIFNPMMYTISLVWKNSQYYNTPARLLVLLQEVCNDVIGKMKSFVAPEEIFKLEPEESLMRIKGAIKALEELKQSFLSTKEKMSTSSEAKPWEFDHSQIFENVNRFQERLDVLEGLFLTVLEFNKLEKIEIGGIQGKLLNKQLQEIFTQFQQEFAHFGTITYDCFDPKIETFSQDISNFSKNMENLEKQIGTLITKAFDDCSSLQGIFKLLESFSGLIERKIIKADLEIKYRLILLGFREEMFSVKGIFEKYKTLPPVHLNFPPYAGALSWCHELIERIDLPANRLKALKLDISETEDGVMVFEEYEALRKALMEYQGETYAQWAATIEENSKQDLSRSLICKKSEEDAHLRVNFSDTLIALLREVKYLSMIETEIPESASQVFEKDDTFRQYRGNFQLIVKQYNEIKDTLLDVEAPLVTSKLEAIDKELEKGLESMNWESAGVVEYVDKTKEIVLDLSSRLHKAKSNVIETESIMKKWMQPLYERKDGKKALDMEVKDKLAARYEQFGADNEKIHSLLKDSMEALYGSEGDENWKAYCVYFESLVLDGIVQTIMSSLKYLSDNMEESYIKEHDLEPLILAKFELVVPNLIFSPEMDENSDAGFFGIIQDMFDNIYKVSSIIKRFTTSTPGEDVFFPEVSENSFLNTLKDSILQKAYDGMKEANMYRLSMGDYAYLWKGDRTEFMRQFVVYGHVLSAEEIEAAGEAGPVANPPKLEDFDQQISSYESIYVEVMALAESKTFVGWLKIDAQPFKQSLGVVVKKWSYAFIEYMHEKVTQSLRELEQFIQTITPTLGKSFENADYDTLVSAMGVLFDIKNRTDETDNMFEPLHDTISLLSKYKVDVPDEIHTLLQTLPEEWTKTKKSAYVLKQTVAPLQAGEVAKLRSKADKFQFSVHEFREDFRKRAPFQFDMREEESYALLDVCLLDVIEMENQAQELLQSASLFEVAVHEHKQLKDSRKDLKMLKNMWDMIGLVRHSFKEWQQTLWSEIDVDFMEMESKKFVKSMRLLDKEMRAWDAYNGLDKYCKNMMTSLRSVGELRNPAIRDRHWKAVIKSTGVNISITDTTKLEDLMALELHNFEDEVKNIVDRATKELNMEKVLGEMEKTWSAMEFTFDKHEGTGTPLLQSSDELVEALEDNQVALQTLSTSRFVDYFIDEITKWQKSLANVDQVMGIWLEVQHTWTHLENIFIGSDDIRAQLPEDSKRFDGIDADFKELMKDAENTPNAVEACGKKGIYEKLEDMQGRLSLCEKSLAEYLETKRLAFPRFYFVSPNDLLDILAKGNNPSAVSVHLTKLFDNIASLEFDESGKQAKGMYSKENEYVPFKDTCSCTGAVENWLNKLIDSMRESLRHYLGDSTVTYEEKQRESWLFDYPAQIALAGSQIWWTTEVNIAFGRLAEGYENAMKDYHKKIITQLTGLITLIQGELKPNDRQKIMVMCTIDVHGRDIVAKLIREKEENSGCFSWQSQLRIRWDDESNDAYTNICDAVFRYNYEYLGNTPRLVITGLTDRCYITLTQSLHLVMGGAPAGPAGTGKTETTKDLGRALGIMVYVFNCSEQMDYKSCGNIYKGLAQSGTWGCFDEFNRISIEVLSVVATQVKSIHDAIGAKKKRFVFQGEDIPLIPTVGVFITMNPGYAGRTELPENMKALFRPCSMVVPDFNAICEIMLMAEGFIDAKLLSRKFVTLYSLNKELLSKQDHYDWGLRAVKSVLVVAGSLKRADRDVPEEHVLMRALRDFNTPKIVTDDMPVFMGLINDLFPKCDIPRKRDAKLEETIKKATVELGLQTEENYILKVVQLDELLAVRHSVFIIGGGGAGKTQVWKTLAKAYSNSGNKTVVSDLNPKTTSNDELYGYISAATREWKDGLFSCIMRDLANLPGDNSKWIMLDGDIDPMWIESLNTVMDDNKILTLASNERIPVTPPMRLIFEIGHLRCATPATVSRAGILFVNPSDLGWNPYVTSWIERIEENSQKANLTVLFEKYVPACLEASRSRFKKITPISEFSMIHTLCCLLSGLLTNENTPNGCDKEWYEIYFTFACIWAFGSACYHDQVNDHRLEFSKWWTTEFKSIKYPSSGTVFDYYVDQETKKFLPWSEKITPYNHDPDMPLQDVLVATSETIRIRFVSDILAEQGIPIMLIGNAGCGKTVLIKNKLAEYGDDKMVVNVSFNNYTTAAMLQGVMEAPLEKKAGRNYGPPGSKKLTYFIDDFNMPEVDTYGTQQPHTLLRQHLDYKHWYDRQKLVLKEIHNISYIAAMNPTSGSFTINPRLQRHFSVFAVNFPGTESLQQIYSSLFSAHVQSFAPAVVKCVPKLMEAALSLNKRVMSSFLPTAIKFHYNFNLRDLSNIFQGLMFSTANTCKTPMDLARLWTHECMRVYGDKLIDNFDRETLNRLQKEHSKKYFDDLPEEELYNEPLIFTHFSEGIGDPKYLPVPNWGQINKILEEALEQYNDTNAAMDLVLFEDAMRHICKINRIMESARGNALLVGVGGSGKQSLARLAAFISGLEVFQIALRKGYSPADFKADIAQLYMRAGIKGEGIAFLLTDQQVVDEQFLVFINDLLSSGVISDLFADDDLESCINGVRSEVKGQGIIDSRENCWDFFIAKVRRNLKVILCFSPVGSTLRVRSRKFPALTSCAAIDWFSEWPEEALISVSQRFIQESELIPEDLRVSVSHFMAHVHKSVNEASQRYLVSEKRYNYTTPKTFLELIKLYKDLLSKQGANLIMKMERLENGLTKLESTAQQVDDLKAKLATQEVILKQKNDEADALLQRVAVDTEKVNAEKKIAEGEEQKVAEITKEVSQQQADCEKDLEAAEPALVAAQEALNTLNKNNLTELKSFGTPPDSVVMVTAAVMVLLNPPGKLPKDRSWKAAKGMMNKVDSFLDALITFDKENIDKVNLTEAQNKYLTNPEFDPEFIRSKSAAAAGLCSWVKNIIGFYLIFCDVEPKRNALAAANQKLTESQEKLAVIKAKIEELDGNLAELTAAFENATNEKLRCEEEATSTQTTIVLANRLVNGLASEKIRWGETVQSFKKQEETLAGDVLLSTAFISYVGCFSKSYRSDLLDNKWRTFLKEQNPIIPLTEDLDPLELLCDDAMIATWNNEGLPTDRTSIENAVTLVNAARWPLLIDPQLQGVEWIKKREGDSLRVVRIGAKGYLDTLEKAVSAGDVVLLENIGEALDPVLDPLIGRNTIKKGKYIKFGDKEVEYDSRFRLIIQTKLANPHYPPEIQAQTTLINFTVTQEGLEDQLLADVVINERPDLEKTKAELTVQQNEFKIKLKDLEDALLSRLSAAEGNFLGDTALVENLEITKRTAAEIEEKVKDAKETEKDINLTRESYRPVAARASLLYFLLNDLQKINPMYQFSLKAFNVVFHKSIVSAEADEDVKQRVLNLIDCVTYSVFIYTTRGLFTKDKLIFTAQMTFQILRMKNDINEIELNFLLQCPIVLNVRSPVDFLSDYNWGAVKAASNLEELRNLANDLEGSSKRWKKFCESECPEREKFPQEWKNKTTLEKLCVLRAIRPDRMTYAVTDFVAEKLGTKYVESADVELSKSFEEASPSTPMFFILSPGVDPTKAVELLGKKMGFSEDANSFHNVSLGQGQEVIAEQKLELAYKEGGWVMLQNIHLVVKWLPQLEKKLEAVAEGSHPDFRVFLSAEPAGNPAAHVIPNGILQSSIKITNEPPTGMKANMARALGLFSQETLEMCSKEAEFKSILISMCYFHAVVLERRKFGPQGWNRPYPFTNGDITICVNVLYNYLEANSKVPWADLKYIFGEIMYGGHISDDWDRRLCSTYLDVYLKEELLEGELEYAPGFSVPPNSDFKGYKEYIETCMPAESPMLYGLHTNAEIEFLTQSAEALFKTIFEMQPTITAGGEGSSREEKVKGILDDIVERLPDNFSMMELMAKAEDRTPYVTVSLQECERMNILVSEMRRGLKELDLGLKGDLTISDAMEELMTSLFLNKVPVTWASRAYASEHTLAIWYGDMLQRYRELDQWTGDFNLPNVVWLPGLFNPQSFLTAVMQVTARKNEWPLDKMTVTVDVTKKNKEDMNAPPREGSYIHGLFMEGARWDVQSSLIQESHVKDLTPAMPVIYVKAITVDKAEMKGVYQCPIYRTKMRGPTYIWTFNLKTKEKPHKWTLAGVCILLSV
eukprot:Nk52_evm51s230 gene=Nk52_evmTU51s230